MSDLERLFEAVRDASNKRTWSRGIELARAGAVVGVAFSTEEVTCRVKLPMRIAAVDVTLYPPDAEWDCTCGSRIDPCECVVAATIAVKRAHEAGDELPQASAAQAHVVYRFSRGAECLGLRRYLVQGDGRQSLLDKSVVAAAAAHQGLVPTQADLNVDRLLIAMRTGSLQAELLWAILEALADAPHVELDGEPTKVAATALAPTASVEDAPSGFRVVLRTGAEVREVLAAGVALVGDTMHRLSHTDLTGPRLERLPSEKLYPRRDAAELITEVLPNLVKRFHVEVATAKLPRLSRALRPRIVLDTEQQEHRLSVMPTLVYGDPPCARVDAGVLVHLGGDLPIRDEEAERHLIGRLRDQLDLGVGRRTMFEGDLAASFAVKLQGWSGELRGDKPGSFVHSSELTPNLLVEGDGFSMTFASSDGSGVEASAEAVISAWYAGSSMVPLMEGGWAPLPSAWLDQHGYRVAELLSARERGSGKVAGHARLALAQLCEDTGHALPASLTALAALLGDFCELPRAQLPSNLKATLRDYQRQGIDWLCFVRDAGLGAVLADDMGLGKTLQALCSINPPCLVVCPRSLIYNWADELKKFRPGLRFDIYHGPQRKLDAEADITLTTYAILRLDQALLSARHWASIVLDESQNIKNPDSQVSQAAYTLQADFRLALSGTPVENRLEELWSQLHFTNPGLLGSRSEFSERFAVPIGNAKPGAAAALRQRIRPFVLRRLKRDVAADLPPRTEVVLHCELSDEERATYDAVRAATQEEVLKQLAAGSGVLAALEALLRLRQAACHPALLTHTRRKAAETASGEGATSPPGSPPGVHAADNGEAASSKLECLLDALQSAAEEGHKALVFSQWTSLLDLVEPLLVGQGITFTRLDGSTRDRAAVVSEFQAEAGPQVMLLSLKAGGTGLNLTAADYVFLLDPWWNPATEDQAADRAHRIGQDKPVVVYRLVAKDTVEERILDLQAHKRQLAEAALGEAAMAARLTREDLLALLEA